MKREPLPLHVDIVSNYGDFIKLKYDWENVYGVDPQAQFFLSWSWLQQVFSHYKSGWFIIAVRDADSLNKHIAFFTLANEYTNERQLTNIDS